MLPILISVAVTPGVSASAAPVASATANAPAATCKSSHGIPSSCRIAACCPQTFPEIGQAAHSGHDWPADATRRAPPKAAAVSTASVSSANATSIWPSIDGIAGPARYHGDDAVRRRGEAEHRLHRLQHDKDLAARDRHARLRHDLRDLSRDRRDQPAARIVLLGRGADRIRQAETPGLAALAHGDDFALAYRRRCAGGHHPMSCRGGHPLREPPTPTPRVRRSSSRHAAPSRCTPIGHSVSPVDEMQLALGAMAFGHHWSRACHGE